MNNIADNVDKVNSCTSCGMCSAICPKQAIKMKLDEDGFYRPQINEALCVSCGLCKKSCYCYEKNYEVTDHEFKTISVSAINKEKKELQQASSGAVSIELMRRCIDVGYKVVGVAYDYDRNIAITKIAETKNEINEFRGSKYFQSFTEDAYREIVKDKSNQKYAIFGTPCQIYAFSKIADLKKNRDKYFFVDIFCHGCPSMNLWKKYLKEKKLEYNIDKFKQINFRSKSQKWHEFCFDFITEEKKYTSARYNDPFYELFFSKQIMNEGCYDCLARSSIIKTDIRLGDFWGWQFDLNMEGVSAVVINSQKGKDIFNAISEKFIIESFSFSDVIKDQSYGKEHSYDLDKRNKLMKILTEKNDMNIYSIQKEYRKMLPVKQNIKRNLKNVVKFTTGSFYTKLRQHNHKKTKETSHEKSRRD